jgi:hypothetical protein
MILSIFVAIYSGAIPHIEKDSNLQITNQVNDSLRQPLQKIGQMGEDIAGIKATLNAWAPLMTAQALRKSIGLPQSQFQKALPELKAVLQTATESKAPVSRDDLSAVGRRTLDLVKSGTGESNLAWETMTTLLQYRSALNILPPPIKLENATPAPAGSVLHTQYHTPDKQGQPEPSMSVFGVVPRDQAAILDTIGVDLNAQQNLGNEFVILRGGTVQLDGFQMRSVVLVNAHVIYEGGPVILQNVYFLNCTFEIKRNENSETLSARLMEPAPTDYNLPKS